MLNRLVDIIKNWLQRRIDKKNRRRLNNSECTLVASNCTGGFLYHWLGLKFLSPFINLYMTPNDFITALEDFETFLNSPIYEVKNTGFDYPVGKAIHGEQIHFVHYGTFEEALEKWEERKKRMDMTNLGILLTNWTNDYSLLKRFDNLPFKHKVVFVDQKFPEIHSAFTIKGLALRGGRNIYATQNITGRRYIDQFDYVDFINHLKD